MLKLLVFLSAFAVALCQEFQFIDNLVDFEEVPYQSISLPYPYQNEVERRVLKTQHKPVHSATMMNKGYNVVELPAKLKETQEVKTALSSVNTSVISTLFTVAAKFFGLAKSALSIVVASGPAIILGAVIVIGFCKITSVCTKINSIKSISDIKKEFNTYVTPARLDTVTEFIKEAIRKYQSMQEN